MPLLYKNCVLACTLPCYRMIQEVPIGGDPLSQANRANYWQNYTTVSRVLFHTCNWKWIVCVYWPYMYACSWHLLLVGVHVCKCRIIWRFNFALQAYVMYSYVQGCVPRHNSYTHLFCFVKFSATNWTYLSTYLTNLIYKICFTLSFISCLYMFRAHVVIIRSSKLHYTASGIITPIGVMILWAV